MKRAGIGLLVILSVMGLMGLACGRTISGVHNANLSIMSQTLYGARADKVIPFKKGEKVTINITADEPMIVFLHGYQVETTVKPGETSTLQFTADVLGRFPLMIHSLGEAKGSHVEILLGLVDILPGK